MKSGSKFETGLHGTISRKSLTINQDRNPPKENNDRFDEIDQVLALILVNQERLEKENKDRTRELDEIKSSFTRLDNTM